MTKVYVYPDDPLGCGFYRVIWPADAVARQGVDVTVVPPDATTRYDLGADVYPDGRINPKTLVAPDDADVIVLQRPHRRWEFETLVELQRRGVAVVIEIDDDLTQMSRRHPMWSILQAEFPPVESWHGWLTMACEQADLVTCSTPALVKRFGGHGRARLLRNRLPAGWARHLPGQLPQSAEMAEHVITWPAQITSHPDDLRAIGNAAARGPAVPWQTIAPEAEQPQYARHAARLLGLPPDRLRFLDPVDLEGWPRLLQRLWIAVAPLDDTPFNRAKSWLKPLELAAAGIPFVASDLPEYRELLDVDPSFPLASTPKAWAAALKRLAGDAGMRDYLRWAGIDLASRHTIDRHVDGWCEAWTDGALAGRAARRVP